MTTGGPRSGAPPWRHQWDVPADEASRIQRQGAALVVRSGDAVDARRICGVDVAYAPATADRDGTASCRTDGAGGRLVAAAVVIDADRLEPVDEAVAVSTATFGYHPGLFSFRELPAVLDAVARLSRLPDLIVCDGHGIAHPARFGLASHLGLWLDVPTIGCAKRPMVGAHAPLGTERGARQPLIDRGETVGYALRTRAGVKPVFVSPGHRIHGDAAADWILRLARGYRLPETTRLADRLARRTLDEG